MKLKYNRIIQTLLIILSVFSTPLLSANLQMKMNISSPSSNSYDDSLLKQNISTSMIFDIRNEESLGYLFSSNQSFHFISSNNPELNQNGSTNGSNFGIFFNIKSNSSNDIPKTFEIDYFTSQQLPLNFENPEFWNYSSSMNDTKNSSYESLFSGFFFPNDIYISDLQQNNSALLQLEANNSFISGINLKYFYNQINDSLIQNNLNFYRENSTNLSGIYNATWFIHGNSSSGSDIFIELSMTQNLTLSDRHIIEFEDLTYYFNATVLDSSTRDIITQYCESIHYKVKLMHEGTNLFPVPILDETTTNTDSEYESAEYDENGFYIIKLILISLGILITIIIVSVLILTRSKDKNKKVSYKNEEKQSSHSSYIGRMDTPAPLKDTKDWVDLNPNHYKGRMNTPPRIKINKFCPNCGNEISSNMIKLMQGNKSVFCRYCGEKLDKE